MDINATLREVEKVKESLGDIFDQLAFIESFAKDKNLKRWADEAQGDIDAVHDKVATYEDYIYDVRDEVKQKEKELKFKQEALKEYAKEAIECFAE